MRVRLAIVIALCTLGLVLAAVAFAATPPNAGLPADNASFMSGDTITFEGTATATPPPPHLLFYVSKDPATNSDGSLVNGFPSVRGDPTISDPTTFDGTAGPANIWPSEPGDYYWQVYQDCGATPPDCTNWSTPPRKLTITPRPASTVSPANPPNTFLDRHPRHRTHKRKATFSFKSDVAGANFQCFYAQGWAKCKSPHVFRNLKPGRYRFKVKAVINGVEDPTPASWLFRVLR